jgi:hypothetical protein
LQHLRDISGARLFFLQLQVPLPVGKDQNVSVLLKVALPAGWSQCSADLQQCAEDMDLTTGMWSTEKMCKIDFFHILNVGITQKRPLIFFLIFLMRGI